jgi:flagellar biosynthesis/type III secretory pathway protein FliH
MSTPPAPPAPPQPPPPAPPAPQPPAPQPPAPPAPPADPAEAVARLESTVAQLRREAAERTAELDRLRQQGMSDAENAIAKAKEEGRAEAAAEHARQLAAAEFRAQATSRLADPEAALAVLDLGKLLGQDGQPDKKAIGKLVDQLAAVPPPPGRVPPGPMPGPQGDGNRDWLRDIQRTR